MQKVAKTISARLLFGRKCVNCNCYRLISALYVTDPSSSKSAVLQTSPYLLNYARAQSTLSSNQPDDRSSSNQTSDQPAAIPLVDFLSQNASTLDPLAGQSDTFNAALAVGKFELRFLFPSAFKNRIDEDFVTRMRVQFGADLELLDYGTSECVLRITCAQEDIQDCMDEVLPKLRSDAKIICLLVHVSHAGGIIGKRGKTISSIIQQCSLSTSEINVFRDACNNSTEHIVQLQTTFVKLPKLIEVLARIMHSQPIEGLQQQYNELSYDSFFADKFSKLFVKDKKEFHKRIKKGDSIVQSKVNVPVEPLSQINGEKNDNITRIRRLSGAVITLQKAESEAKFVEMGIIGSKRQIQFVAYLIEQILNGVDIRNLYVLSSEYPNFATAEMSAKPKREKTNSKKYWFE